MFSMLRNIPKPTHKIKYDSNILDNLSDLRRVSGVYIWYGKDGAILYTGRSNNVRERIKYHIERSHNEGLFLSIQNDEVSYISVFPCVSELDTIVLERYLISSDLYRGIHNEEFSTYEFSFEGVEPEEVDNEQIKSVIVEERERREREEAERLRKEQEEKEQIELEVKARKEAEKKRKQERIERKEREVVEAFYHNIAFVENDPSTIFKEPEKLAYVLGELADDYSIRFRTTDGLNVSKLIEKHLSEEEIEIRVEPILEALKSKPSKSNKLVRKVLEESEHVSFHWAKKELYLTMNYVIKARRKGIDVMEYMRRIHLGDAV